MGHKKVCFNCRKAYNLNSDFTVPFSRTCPNCSETSVLVDHKFRPPEKNKVKEWKLAKFLVDHGFYFQRILENGAYVRYPTTMEEAEIFVIKYKKQAYFPDKVLTK